MTPELGGRSYSQGRSDEIGGGRYRGGENGAPSEVDQGDEHRPIFSDRQIRQVVGRVACEAEERAEEKGVRPRLFLYGRGDDENDEGDDENDVEGHGGRPIHVRFQKPAYLLPVQILGDESKPEHVDDEEYRQRDDKKFCEHGAIRK